MSVRRWCVAGAALVLATTLVAPAVASAVAGWTIRELDGAPSGAEVGLSVPSISGDRAVWDRNDNYTTPTVWTFRVGTDTTRSAVTGGDAWDNAPLVSGDRVVWTREVEIGFETYEYRVFTRRIGEPIATQISEDGQDCSYIRVSGDRIAWAQRAGDAPWQVRTIRVGETTTTLVSTSEAAKHRVVVSGDRMAWLEDADETGMQLWTWKAGGGPASLVATGCAERDPAFSGDRFAWLRILPGDNWQVYTQVVGSGTPVQVSNGLNSCNGIAVSGNRLVWASYVGDTGSSRLFTKVIGKDAAPVPVGPQGADCDGLAVSGDRVAWTTSMGLFGDSILYTRRMGADSTPTVMVLNGNHVRFSLSGDRLGWHDSKDRTRIYFAKRITTPKLARTPSSSSATVKRSHGKASKTLAVKVNDADGTLVGGATVKLQYSANGRTRWTTIGTLKSNASGTCSRTVTWKTRGTRYYRWYFPTAAGYNTAYSSKYKVVVK